MESYKVRAEYLDRFFQTAIGKDILAFLGKSIKAQGQNEDPLLLRKAVVKAAADPKGLNLLNILRFASADLELNTNEILKDVKDIKATKSGHQYPGR